jgi:hypothetical protein
MLFALYIRRASLARPDEDVWAYVFLGDHVGPAGLSFLTFHHASDIMLPCWK